MVKRSKRIAENEINVCAICICQLTDDDNIHTMDCSHKFHSECIIVNAQKGNISCPLCRELPKHITDTYDSQSEREYQIDNHNRNMIQSHFLKGLRFAKKKNADKNLKKAVNKYYRKINLHKKYNKLRVEENKIARLMNADIKQMKIAKTKEILLEEKKIKLEYKNKYKMKRIPKISYTRRCRRKYMYTRQRRKIAELVGFVPIPY